MSYPFQIKSLLEYHEAYQKSITNPTLFWGDIASHFTWRKPWETVLDWDFKEPKINWFINGKLNITENCLDRHLAENGATTALIFEPNNPDEPAQEYTYQQLFEAVNDCAAALKKMGIKKGDRVCIYMGMIPQLAISVLACARIGAIHSVVFGGFSAKSIADRLTDAHATFVITCDGAYRGEKSIPLKPLIDEALKTCAFVKSVLVFNRTNTPVSMIENRDIWWHEIVKPNEICLAEEMDSEDPLFILYTSGSTGKPKGVVHSCGGYMVYTAYTFINVFQYKAPQKFFCTADIGWITGHSYLLYGPLLAGATTVLFEGTPTYPNPSRLWHIIDKHQVNILYTAPTAIRSLMSFGLDFLIGTDLSSLQVLGTVGEPINEEAWLWYHENIGKKQCPIVDTWWQTETGGILISNLAGITPSKISYATLPLPGVQLTIVDENGVELTGNNSNGNLCIKAPWPSIIRTTYGDHERCKLTYFSTYPELYFTGDGCFRDENGNYKITGRVDDVLNISGHRIGTAELENAINLHENVIESAVVGFPHEIKGQGIYAFVIISQNEQIKNEQIKKQIIEKVVESIGAIAKPDKIQFVIQLPKTRSGKIMRRILRKIAEGAIENIGDTTTLLDPTVVAAIISERI